MRLDAQAAQVPAPFWPALRAGPGHTLRAVHISSKRRQANYSTGKEGLSAYFEAFIPSRGLADKLLLSRPGIVGEGLRFDLPDFRERKIRGVPFGPVFGGKVLQIFGREHQL